MQGDVEDFVKGALQDIANEKGITLLKHETVVDHVHLLLALEPSESLSKSMNLLKGISSRKVFLKYPDVRLDAGVNHFWQKRYGARQVEPANLANVWDYIHTQKDHLERFDRLSTTP